MGLYSAIYEFAIQQAPPECPDCGSALEQGYVRAPGMQPHWRGVKALECPDCGYAEALEDESPEEGGLF